MARTLRTLVATMGIVCCLIGVFHFALGIDSVPGEAQAGATVDSRERFYGAIFVGYGLAWLWAWCHRPIERTIVCWLAGVFLLGGVGRLLSMAIHGQPQWFQTVLTIIELALPVAFFILAGADESAARQAPSDGGPR